jgi:hypothetical protein
MTGIGKKFNWVSRPSTWGYVQAWKNQRAKMAQKFIEEGSAAVNAFASAQYNHTTGLVANAQQAAITRLQAAAKKQGSVNMRA